MLEPCQPLSSRWGDALNVGNPVLDETETYFNGADGECHQIQLTAMVTANSKIIIGEGARMNDMLLYGDSQRAKQHDPVACSNCLPCLSRSSSSFGSADQLCANNDLRHVCQPKIVEHVGYKRVLSGRVVHEGTSFEG